MRFGTDSTRERFGEAGRSSPVIKSMDNKTRKSVATGIGANHDRSDLFVSAGMGSATAKSVDNTFELLVGEVPLTRVMPFSRH